MKRSIKRNNDWLRLISPVLVGLAAGYVLLHPLSVAVVFIFERHFFNLVSILLEAFSVVHLGMGLYFTLIGGFIGLLFVLFHYRTRKTNTVIIGINDQLKRQNEELLKSIHAQSVESPVMGELWLTLNQVHKGVDLLSSGSIGGVNQRQSALLEITQENIKELINIIEKSTNLNKRGTME